MDREIDYISRNISVRNHLREMFKIKQVKCCFDPVWRGFISGSSSAGKTHFARLLLEAKLFKFRRVYYYHPDINEQFPTNWNQFLAQPVIYQAGLPTTDDLLDLPSDSCIILDDLFREAAGSQHIDYLFRVLSGKMRLHVIIMTQRYFDQGAYALSIRNSSNYHVLMNNADRRINCRAAHSLGLKTDFMIAERANQSKLYPYIFIDQTNKARVSGLQVYTDILSKHKEVIFNSMLGVWMSKTDFNSNFELIDQNTAVKNANSTKSKNSESCSDSTQSDKNKEKSDTEKEVTNARHPERDNKTRKGPTRAFKKYLEKRRIERSVREALQRRHFSAKL